MVTLEELLDVDQFTAAARVDVVVTLTRARASREHRVWLFGEWCRRVDVVPERWEVMIIWRGRYWCTCAPAQPSAAAR